ncbi:hypothetical protein COCSADRAFT_39287 [Bipolaris sorokiniana ND90Pr]|uniref:Uncharacterized protein n=1 Tax=Cochliobolus sativus (strain ND90Pr / ATCC 201652) TaxID=665912 RepID=M2R310_COCSN|nr:uncharacterized protein COCSADRAFT_39287 [Bipolaris sorokiniana ND90Pr]EMD61584.1 hypothetical protein COCSADRAFT_39287 [Bipolaris sorokiniana ND90Pr]
MREVHSASDIVPHIKTIEVYESPADLESLRQSKFKLCLAHTFLANNNLVSTLAWKSLSPAPFTPITWQASYALNWTDELPNGISDPITLSGLWQPCKKGEVFDLDPTGLWSRSSKTPVPGKLMVGINRFKGDIGTGVFIVIGLKGKDDKFDPIFIDHVNVGLNMSAIFEPSDVVKWWYRAEIEAAETLSPEESYDMATVSYVSSTYSYVDGVWATSIDRAPRLV